MNKNIFQSIYYKNLPKGIKEGIDACPLIIGIGPSAWPRIITSYFFPKFKTICLNDSQDDEFIRNSGNEVFSLKKENPDTEVSPQTPGRILDTDLVKNYVKAIKEPFSFLVYKSSSYLEKVCSENKWNFIGNKKYFMDIYENKKFFKEILREIGVETIPGENIPINDLTDEKFIEYQEKLGQKKLVLQLAEMTYGGGSGTFFIEDVKELSIFRGRVTEIRKNFEGKKKKIETVNIAPFIEGTSCSVSCAATHKGTLIGPIQTQIIDIPEVAAHEKGRSGVYAGTDWGLTHYSKESQEQAENIAKKFGEYIYKAGYKGIFGLDLIVEKSGKVWPVECNPRDTDAFPMVSMLMMDAGCVPLDVFHNLEHLGVTYDFDYDEINNSYKNIPFDASQIIIENRLPSACYIAGSMKAGVYTFDEEGKLTYKKEGCSLFDLENDKEVLITEGVPKNYKDRGYPMSGRIFRVIKRGKMLDRQNYLSNEMLSVVESIYKKLKLVSVPTGVVEKGGINNLYINRPSMINDYWEELKKTDIVNLIGEQGGDIVRPSKIAWRKDINLDVNILSQIPSKKTQKNIKFDLDKSKTMGINVNTYEEITFDQFNKWLILYKKIIGQKQNGELMINEEWFKEKKSKGKKIGAIFAEKNGEIIGGDLFFEINGRLSVGYGVAEKVSGLRGGLMLLIDFEFLNYAKNKHYKEVSFGQDTNLYGADLSIGLVSYKTKLGFKPVPANNTFLVTSYFQKMEKFGEEIVTFIKQKETLVPFIITDKINETNYNYYSNGVVVFRNKEQINTNFYNVMNSVNKGLDSTTEQS